MGVHLHWRMRCFLPLALLAYFAVPARGRWAVLLAFSYGFYMSWHPQLILLLWLDYPSPPGRGGLALGRAPARAAGRGAALALGVLPCLGALFFFKYFAFAARNAWPPCCARSASVFRSPPFSLVLPLGISFYTFQALGYLFRCLARKGAAGAPPGVFLRCSSAFSRSWSRGPSAGRGGAAAAAARAPHRPDPRPLHGRAAAHLHRSFQKGSSLPIFSPSMPTTSLTR